MDKVLVTGVAGFIGSHVAEQLCSMGYEVVGIDNLSGGYIENVPKHITFENVDIANEKMINNLFEIHQFQYVFHLAAYAAEGLSHFIRNFNYTNNLIGSVNLINASINNNVERFIFTSSMAVYGTSQVPFKEEYKPQPEDPYGVAKYAIEQDLQCAYELFGLKYTIFRPHNVVGIRQNFWDSYRNVVGIFIHQAINGKPITIFGDGEQTRAFSYIDDISIPIANCIEITETENEIFNIGGDKYYQIKDIAKMVKNSINSTSEIIHLPPRYEVKHAHCSHNKVDKIFKHKSNKPMNEVIKEMVEWYKTQPSRPVTKWGSVEVEKNLPARWKELLDSKTKE